MGQFVDVPGWSFPAQVILKPPIQHTEVFGCLTQNGVVDSRRAQHSTFPPGARWPKAQQRGHIGRIDVG